MRRQKRTRKPRPLWQNWMDFALGTGEMLKASAYVINHRTDRMAKAGLTPTNQDMVEFTRMFTEKAEAAAESTWALSSTMFKMQADMMQLAWKQALSGPQSFGTGHNGVKQVTRLANSMAELAHAGLEPLRSRAVANRKRLGKRRHH